MRRGTKPIEDRTTVRNRMPVLEWNEFPDTPFDGPVLPQRWVKPKAGPEVKRAWPRVTVRWWETVRTMPHCRDWAPTDWEFGFMTAELHARLSEGKGSFTELRQREALMGMTSDARVGQRIRYVKPSVASKVEQEAPASADNVVAVDFGEMYGDAS